MAHWLEMWWLIGWRCGGSLAGEWRCGGSLARDVVAHWWRFGGSMAGDVIVHLVKMWWLIRRICWSNDE